MKSLTLNEAAEVLGVATSTLRHQIRNGKLKARHWGYTWLVSAEEVGRYARENRRAREEEAS